MSSTASKSSRFVALNELESKLMRFKGGISACNLFQSEQKEEVVNAIHERFQEIVRANPWLKGSCAKRKKGVFLDFDPEQTNAGPLIFSGQAPKSLTQASPYTDILKACEPYIVEKAFKLYGKKDRLTKLVILHLDDKRFFLMFSLSHLIADGYTFYAIFNMLSSDREVYSLGVERRDEVAQIRDIIPKSNSNYLFHPRMLFWGIGRAFSRKKMRIKGFELNATYVQQQKQEIKAEGGVAYVSTNDILSAVYAQLCKTKALIMAVNFRHRIPEITDKDAGNYEQLLVIDQAYSKSPVSIRKLVANLTNEVANIDLPKGAAMSNSNPVLITNWAGFSQPIVLEGAEELVHMPLYTSREITFDSCIVYAPRAGVVAALLFMKDLPESKVLAHPLFAKA